MVLQKFTYLCQKKERVTFSCHGDFRHHFAYLSTISRLIVIFSCLVVQAKNKKNFILAVETTLVETTVNRFFKEKNEKN